MINDTLEPREAAFIATNAYFTLKDWNNYSDGKGESKKVVKPVAGAAASMIDVHDRVLGDEKIGTFQNRHHTSLKKTDLRNSKLEGVHTAKTGNAESGFGYTLERPHEYRQLAGEFTDILGYAAKWAINQVIKAADITVTILKAILDKMLAAIKTMAMGALTRGPVGLTAMGLAIPGMALMSAEAI